MAAGRQEFSLFINSGTPLQIPSAIRC